MLPQQNVVTRDPVLPPLNERTVVSSPDPTHKMGKGLVTLLAFLGCAESAKITYIFVGKCHVNADSAQPRKASNVTRPFPILWLGSGDETTRTGE